MSKKKTTLGDLEKKLENLDPDIQEWIDLQVELAKFATRLKAFPFETYIYLRYEELRETMTVNAAYDELCKIVRKRGVDPETCMNDDPDGFNRAYNGWKGRRLREK